jgi:acetolactate synthase I/II/III large subunit
VRFRLAPQGPPEGALDEFLNAAGPSFLEVVTDREEAVFPFIPAGKGYKDMVLGPYIGNGE